MSRHLDIMYERAGFKLAEKRWSLWHTVCVVLPVVFKAVVIDRGHQGHPAVIESEAFIVQCRKEVAYEESPKIEPPSSVSSYTSSCLTSGSKE